MGPGIRGALASDMNGPVWLTPSERNLDFERSTYQAHNRSLKWV